MKNIIITLLLITISTFGSFAQSQNYVIQFFVSGGLQSVNCNGSASLNATLDTGPGTPVLAFNSVSGPNSFKQFTLTYSTPNPLNINYRIRATGSASCPGISGGNTLTSNFMYTTSNIPATCGNIFLFNQSSNNYSTTVNINIIVPLAKAPTFAGPSACSSTIDLSIDDQAPSFDWQVSELGTAGSFVTFRINAPKDITANVNELTFPGFTTSKFDNRYIRAIGNGCAVLRVGLISNSLKFNVAPPGATLTPTNPKCYGENSGSVKVDIISADPSNVDDFVISLFDPYNVLPTQISIQNSFTHTFTNLSTFNPNTGLFEVSKTYTVNVENNSGATFGSCSANFNVTIFNPSAITLAISGPPSPVSCNVSDNGNKNDGAIQLQVTNGVSAYSYQVSKDGGPFVLATPNSTTSLNPIFSSLSAGNYVYKVTDSNGCTSSSTAAIAVNQPPAISTLLNTKTDVLCLGKNRGAIDATVSGGNGGYNYGWSATGPYAPYVLPAAEDLSNLFAGDYSLTVTDAKGCANVTPLSVTITEPALPVIVNATIFSQTLFGGFDMSCALNDGIVELDFDNELQPINSFTWTKDGNPFTPSSFTYAENLTPGNYGVTIIDSNNCDASTSVTLNPHPGITAVTKTTSSFNGFNTKCPDTNEGEGFVESVTNGFGTLSYTWFDGSTNQSIADLLPGNYLVTVIDGNGCSDDGTLVITPPPAIQPNMQITSNYNGESITCPGATDGAMEAFPLNGFGTYAYLWDHGPTTKATSGLAMGTYSVTVTDDYGCSVKNSLVINDPAMMQLNMTKTSYNGSDLSCHDDSDGQIQLNVVNGIAPYAYAWSEGSTSQNIAGLPAANYSVTVTDQNNCEQTNNIEIINPEELVLDMQHPNNFNGFDITCNGLTDGSARAFLSGGTTPYSYSWLGGQNTETISGQAAGMYSVVVLDANNCPNNGSITLTEPPVLQVTAAIDNPVSCFGGTDGQISVAGLGGAGTYSYSLGGSIYQPSNIFSGLAIGIKDLFLKDGNSCVTSTQETMTQPDAISISFQNIVEAQCNDPVGSAKAVATGGNGGYNFSWFDEPSNLPMNTGDVLVNAIASIYRVEILDVKNCPASDLVAISSIGGAEFDLENITGVTCFGFTNGSADINVTSGITPYAYQWSDGQTLPLATNLKAGNYFATVIDGLGCKTIKPLTISTPAALIASHAKTLPNCVGDCDGVINTTITGGTQPYAYDWTTLSLATPLVSGLCKGDYNLRVTDSKNCLLEELVNLPDPAALDISGAFTRPICLGRCDGSIQAIGQGGTGPYQFEWQGGPSASLYASLCPGDYDVTMTDSHGCLTSNTLTLLPGDPLPLDLGGEATLCVGQSKVLDAGSNWATINWTSNTNFISSAQIITINEPGTYFLKGIDAIGCIGLDTFKLATSLDLLKAEFLMPSEVVVGDTLVAIDISWPLPDRVEWTYPGLLTVLPSENPDFLFAIIPEAGSFKIGMRSFLAECRDFREKDLLVLAAKNENAGGRLGYQNDLVQQFSVSPNPNDGRFDVNILLKEEKEIKLQVVSFPAGMIEASYDGSSADFHQVEFELSDLVQGMYFVLLRVGDEQRLLRFIKH